MHALEEIEMRTGVTFLLIFVSGAFVGCRQEPRTIAAASAKDRSPAPPTQPAGKIAPRGNVESYADVVAHVAPAVVTVRAQHRVKAPQQFPFSEDPFLQHFFGGQPNQQRFGTAPQQVERALGSGVIVRPDGQILTNHHVIDGAQEISVDLTDRRTFKAKLVGSDTPSDLAVLKIDANNLPVLSPGDSDKVRVGDVCLAVGNPLGIGQTVTAGIISAKGRQTDLSDGNFEDFLQTDASINQGNSGGALVDTAGELIGINSQILSPSGGNIGIGFAIPSNMAKNVMDQLIAKGKVSRGQLGVTVQYINSDLAASLGMKEVRGVLVNNVSSGGAADRAGLKSGDVILAINGTPINDVNELRNRIAQAGSGADVTLTTLRNNNQQQVRVKLGEFNPKGNGSGGNNGGGDQNGAGRLGISVTPVTPEIASQLGVPRNTQGLVVESVDPGGAAADAGIQMGDIIEQINRQPVRSASDLQSGLTKSGDRPALLLINRGGQKIFLPVRR
jgi:serine protease Do